MHAHTQRKGGQICNGCVNDRSLLTLMNCKIQTLTLHFQLDFDVFKGTARCCSELVRCPSPG